MGGMGLDRVGNENTTAMKEESARETAGGRHLVALARRVRLGEEVSSPCRHRVVIPARTASTTAAPLRRCRPLE